MSGPGRRLREWRPATPQLPDHLTGLVKPGDPEWFARELAIAAAPPWWFWRLALRRFSWLVGLFGTVEVTGEVPEELRRGPLLLAANHIGDFDPFVIAVALHKIGVVPRIMATGGIISSPVAGPLLERTGAIRVERGTELARHAVRITEVALVQGGHVVAYPEGRVGLTADGWPERGRTGMARMALGLGVPVIPVSQWGAHEVLQYGNDWGKLRTVVRALVRRPRCRCTSVLRWCSTTCRWAGSATPTGPGIASRPRSPAVWCRCAPVRTTVRTTSTRPGRRRRWPPSRAVSSPMTSPDRRT